MKVHLVDGTYELFRHYFAAPPTSDTQGNKVGAVRGVLASVLGMIEGGATHVGVATDHVIESFRNELYAGYKTSEGVPPSLMAQFPVLEEALDRMGVKVWPMVEFEADDAIAAAAARAVADMRVEQILVCSPDKDLAQCVAGRRVVLVDRMRGITRDEDGVVEKWGVRPESIPDYLAVVGDSADGFPGLPGWGAKAAAATFGRYLHLENIPADWRMWGTGVRGAQRLSSVLREQWEDALLFRRLATLRVDAPVFESVDELEWLGPPSAFGEFCQKLGMAGLAERAKRAQERRGA